MADSALRGGEIVKMQFVFPKRESIATKVEISGLDEIQRNIDAIAKKLSYKEVISILLKGARVVKQAAKRKVGVKTGNLRRAILARGLPDRGGYTPTAIVAVDRRKKAAHVHLVEFGTKARYTKRGKYTGKMPAKPFLIPAWEETKNMVLSQVLTDLKNKIEGG